MSNDMHDEGAQMRLSREQHRLLAGLEAEVADLRRWRDELEGRGPEGPSASSMLTQLALAMRREEHHWRRRLAQSEDDVIAAEADLEEALRHHSGRCPQTSSAAAALST